MMIFRLTLLSVLAAASVNADAVNPDDIQGDLQILENFFDGIVTCGIDVDNWDLAFDEWDPEDASIAAQELLSNAVDHIEDKCNDVQASQFTLALSDFETCSGVDLRTFYETLPSAWFGGILHCLPSLGVDDNFDHYGNEFSEECMDALWGQNPDGDLIRHMMLQPKQTCGCMDRLYADLPTCTLDVWPLPIVGDWVSKIACVTNSMCNQLDLMCTVELDELNSCLPQVDAADYDCQSTIIQCTDVDFAFLTSLPEPLLGMPMPDRCEEMATTKSEYTGVNLAGRYKKFVATCSEPWNGWDLKNYNPSSASYAGAFHGYEDGDPRLDWGSFFVGMIIMLCFVGCFQCYKRRKNTKDSVEKTTATSLENTVGGEVS